jgi:hypothetical protein
VRKSKTRFLLILIGIPMRINQNDFKFLEKFRFWENAHYKDVSYTNTRFFHLIRNSHFLNFYAIPFEHYP